jgi:hypothetical protein
MHTISHMWVLKTRSSDIFRHRRAIFREQSMPGLKQTASDKPLLHGSPQASISNYTTPVIFQFSSSLCINQPTIWHLTEILAASLRLNEIMDVQIFYVSV